MEALLEELAEEDLGAKDLFPRMAEEDLGAKDLFPGMAEEDFEAQRLLQRMKLLFSKEDRRGEYLHLLYSASKMKIYQVADKIAGSQFEGDVDSLRPAVEDIEVPVADEWDFQLGDIVKIKHSKANFKYIQQETFGWRKQLLGIADHYSIVTDHLNKFENKIRVYTPDIFSRSDLYAGVLEKQDKAAELHSVRSQWKIGQYVKIRKAEKAAELLQRRYDTIPDKYMGKTGRVIAITSAGVFVTFDERSSYSVNPAALLSSDKSSMTVEPPKQHSEYKIGERVQIISNLKKLIENQKGSSRWNSDMCSLAGQEATVIDISDENALILGLKNKRAWRLSVESVKKLCDAPSTSQEKTEDDLKIKPGDKIRVRISENIKSIFASKEIPTAFLEYVNITAIVDSIDDDMDPLITFSCDQNVGVDMKLVRKATEDEVKHYDEVDEKVKNMKPGDTVYLDVGPQNYVKLILAEENAEASVMIALTTPSTLLGFAESGHAVISYEDDMGKKKMYKIKKKYLTVPKKFGVTKSKEVVELETILKIRNEIQRSVKAIHTKELKEENALFGVDTLSMALRVTPPTVTFRICSPVVTTKILSEEMQEKSDWKIEHVCEGIIYVFVKPEKKIKINLFFNDDECQTVTSKEQAISEITETLTGAGEKDVTATPPLHNGNVIQERQEIRPDVQNVSDFSFYQLYDQSLAHTVYFPYLVSRTRRVTQEPAEQYVGAPTSDQINYQTNITAREVNIIHH